MRRMHGLSAYVLLTSIFVSTLLYCLFFVGIENTNDAVVTFLLSAALLCVCFTIVAAIFEKVRRYLYTKHLSNAASTFVDLHALTFMDEGTLTKDAFDDVIEKSEQRQKQAKMVHSYQKRLAP